MGGDREATGRRQGGGREAAGRWWRRAWGPNPNPGPSPGPNPDHNPCPNPNPNQVAYMAAKGVGMKPADEDVKTRQPGFWRDSSRPYR